jgi:5-methylcytosine-specific restriction endonuclease McrA
MGRKDKNKPVSTILEEADIRRERAKARELRESQWWKRQLAKGRCHYCGRNYPSRDLTMDHVIPISRGGKSTKGNVVPSCKKCNTAKKQLLPMEWEKYINSWSMNALLS